MTRADTHAKLLALAARVEAAEGADRELDALVLAAIVGGEARLSPFNHEWCVYVGTTLKGRPRLWEARGNIERKWWDNHAFTASLDAAASLVPSGWRINQIGEWDHDTLRTRGPWLAILIPAGKSDDFSWVSKARCNHAATPALALTAAALRALAMEAGDE